MTIGLCEQAVTCPYCGETAEIFLDLSVDEQRYIEDCQVCCRPMDIHCQAHESEFLAVTAERSD